MKFSKTTRAILHNFLKIRTSFLFEEGNVLTVFPVREKIITARAVIAEEIPREVGIDNLTALLDTLKLFDEPNVEFGDKSLIISEPGKGEAEYFYTETDFISHDWLNVPRQVEGEFPFTITHDMLTRLLRAAQIFDRSLLTVTMENGSIAVRVSHPTNSAAGHFEIYPEETVSHDVDVKAMILIEHVQLLMNSDYRVSVHPRMVIFSSTQHDLVYQIAVQSGSHQKIKNEASETP